MSFVVVNDQTDSIMFHEGDGKKGYFDNEEAAQSNANVRNKTAEELGIQTRYLVRSVEDAKAALEAKDA